MDQTKGDWTSDHTWDITNTDYQIATIENYFQLMSEGNETNDLSFPISKAYGIVYGDGAREVKTKRPMPTAISKQLTESRKRA